MSDPTDINALDHLTEAIVPVWTLDLEDEEELLKYSKKTLDVILEDDQAVREDQRDNIARYVGVYRNVEPTIGAGLKPELNKRHKWQRIIIPHTRDLVDQKVSKLMKIRPTTSIIPNNSQYTDARAAENSEKVISSIKYQNDTEAVLTKLVRTAIVRGEAFLYVNWNKDLGEEKKKTLKEVTVKDDSGDDATAETVERLGDVEIKNLSNENVVLIPGPEPTIESCPGCIVFRFEHTMNVRAQYPEKADLIEASSGYEIFDASKLDVIKLDNHVLVMEFWFKSAPLLPYGLYWKATPTAILEDPQENPIKMTQGLMSSPTGNLPIEVLTDIDVEGELHGLSSMHNINMLQNQYDKATSLISRNLFMFTHPTIFYPRGACNMEQLTNGTLAVQYSSPNPPTVQTYPAVSQDLFSWWSAMEEKMGKLFNIYALSRGEAPKGSRSASQLMVYDEQEEEARGTFRKKLERLVCSIDAKILSIISERYKAEDGRLARILGDDNRWLAREFKVEDLQKPYTIRVAPSNALPENKYARIRTLLEINQLAPGLLSKEQLIDMMELGQHERFIDYARAAVLAAEAENEALINEDSEVQEPATYEDLITHWLVHAKLVQRRGFKLLPEKMKEKTLDHIRATEYLMVMIQAPDNEAFAARLKTLTNFPLVYVMTQVPGVPGMAPPMPPGLPGPGTDPTTAPSDAQAPGAKEIAPQTLLGQPGMPPTGNKPQMQMGG